MSTDLMAVAVALLSGRPIQLINLLLNSIFEASVLMGNKMKKLPSELNLLTFNLT